MPLISDDYYASDPTLDSGWTVGSATIIAGLRVAVSWAVGANMNLCRVDAVRLANEFFGHYDPAKHENLMSDLAEEKTPPRATFLGEGRHFKAWRIPASGPFDHVVTLSSPEFLEERGTAGISQWIKMVALLGRSKEPLIPPMSVRSLEGRVVSVMLPYGHAVAADLAGHWKPLTPVIASLNGFLADQGLLLDDHWQIKVAAGVPFICDFSDLKRR